MSTVFKSFLSFVFSTTLLVASQTFGQQANSELDKETLFKIGIKLYQEKNYAEALRAFLDTLSKFQEHKSGLEVIPYELSKNIALTNYQLKNKSQAWAYLRQASHHNLNLSEINELSEIEEFFQKEIPSGDVSRTVPVVESLRTGFLNGYSYDWLVFALVFFLALLGWYGIRYIAERKKAREHFNEIPWPSPSLMVTVIVTVFLVSTISLKAYLDSQTYGTVIVSSETPGANLVLWLSPEEKSIEVGPIVEGLEVRIIESKEDWLKVSLAGAYAGWIKKQNVLTY